MKGKRVLSTSLSTLFCSLLARALLSAGPVASPRPAQDGDAPPLISVPSFENGRLRMPQQMEMLEVMVTDRDGAPLTDVAVMFVAPEAGAGGTFLESGDSFYRTPTDGDGMAAATFLANDTAGVYLVDAVIEGTEAAVSFGLTNVGVGSSPAGGGPGAPGGGRANLA